MDNLDKVKEILSDALGIDERKYSITAESNLLGSIPELDSMGVVSVITALAEHFDITINDDEINAKTFETLGSLVSFVEQKLAK
jgi:acyl carrier protein